MRLVIVNFSQPHILGFVLTDQQVFSDSRQLLSSSSVGGSGPRGAAAKTEAAQDDGQHQRPQPL